MRRLAAIPLLFLSALQAIAQAPAHPLTHIQITSTTIRQNVQRMGINLGEQTFYDSGQILRNLVSRNPGFEGAEYRTILHCIQATTTSCTDETPNSNWPEGFWAHADCSWMTGPLASHTCTILSSTQATATKGTVLTLATERAIPLNAYLRVHTLQPGTPTAGWWPEATNGATFIAETRDLAPAGAGHQCLRIEASKGGQTASISSYFDSTEHRTFLRMTGRFRLTFRARGIAGRRAIKISLARLSNPTQAFLTREFTLTPEWKAFSLDFTATEPSTAIGSVRLRFETAESSILLDDVSLERIDGDASNKTAFRDEVLTALHELHPGVLRYMGSTTELGSTIANLLLPPAARQRSGYSPWQPTPAEVPIGIPEFLGLCKAVGADPWITLPAAISVSEMQELIAYLNTNSKGFHALHLEIGNEVWNSVYRGATIEDPIAYADHTRLVFAAARATPGFDPTHFDLIVGGQAVASNRNQQVLDHSAGYDSLAIAPYLMHWVNDETSTNAVFAPLFAEPEMMSTTGIVAQNASAAAHASHRAILAIYEVNLHTTEGRISQAALDLLTSSTGAGIAVATHMLLMLRDAGVTTQAMFSLTGNQNKRSDGKRINLWGTVIDMGATNRRRPQFLALELINSAILPRMDTTRHSGANPTWQQLPGNDDVAYSKVHELQSFAFADGRKHSLVLINLSRSSPNDVDVSGQSAPAGTVAIRQLTSPRITDTNEDAEVVKITDQQKVLQSSTRLTLPPYSITVLLWQSAR